MQLWLSTFLSLGLALVQTSSAAPAPVSALSKRIVDNLPPSDQFITCPGYRYSRPQVEAAVQRGITNTPTNEPQPGMYPPTRHVIPFTTNFAHFYSRWLPAPLRQ
jgi:hypothetical protein